MKTLLGLLLVMGMVGCGDPVAELKRLGAEIEQNEQGEVIGVDNAFRKFTDADLVQLKGLSRLQMLDLTNTEITDAGLVHLKGLANLETLLIGVTKITDAGLVHLKGLTNLKYLELTDCRQLTDAGLAHVKDLTNLQTLNLRFTLVTGAGLVQLAGMNLKELQIPDQAQTDTGLKHYLEAVKPPTELSLFRWKKITDAGLVHIKELTKLRELDLRFTKVTDAGIAELQEALPNCEITK